MSAFGKSICIYFISKIVKPQTHMNTYSYDKEHQEGYYKTFFYLQLLLLLLFGFQFFAFFMLHLDCINLLPETVFTYMYSNGLATRFQTCRGAFRTTSIRTRNIVCIAYEVYRKISATLNDTSDRVTQNIYKMTAAMKKPIERCHLKMLLYTPENVW